MTASAATVTEPKVITIFHSPDADDAFMFYGLVKGASYAPGYDFRHELCDIESLNHRALKGELDVTAISIHAFPYLKGQYAILRCGASMGGKDYGPRVVATSHINLFDGTPRTIAIPGELTSTTLALRIWLKEKGVNAELVNMNFDEVQHAVKRGEVDAGCIIHEGQITHTRDGLTTILDLGQWWWDETGLPLPLGVNIVRKSLGDDAMKAVGHVLKSSIQYALDNRKDALEYALEYGRGITYQDADVFVGMYVNDITIDIGDAGMESMRLFLKKGFDYGFVTAPVELDFVDLA